MIGTGYHERGEWTQKFARLWFANLLRYAPETKQVFVVCAGCEFPIKSDHITPILGQNLGHVGDYVSGQREGQLCGWSASIITLATLAFSMGEDLIFIEQDCLAFGPWIERAYTDMDDGEFVFGGPHNTAPYMPSSQSLFIARHSFLLEFIQRYLTLPKDAVMLPEEKFLRIYEAAPEKCRHLSFGVDRERPIPFDAPVFYSQQHTLSELEELNRRGLCSPL